MKVLVLGGGGREHALVWKLRQSPRISQLYCAPGNGGIADEAECLPADLKSLDSITGLATRLQPDLTVVGPELPLTLGVVDEFNRRGWPVFGPTAAAARLESSKSFAKEFLQRHHIPTAPFAICDSIEQVRSATEGGRRLLVGTSYKGRGIPGEAVLDVSDLALVHGNGVTDPAFIGHMVDETRRALGGRAMPIVFNEDDHYDFDRPSNNMVAAISRHASWGYFDAGAGAGGGSAKGDYVEGYQNVPVNWAINTDRKRSFFGLVREVTAS